MYRICIYIYIYIYICIYVYVYTHTHTHTHIHIHREVVSQVVLVLKNPPANAGDLIPGLGGPWKRKCQPTPVFLAGESPGERSLLRCIGPQRVSLHTHVRNTSSRKSRKQKVLRERSGPAFTDGETEASTERSAYHLEQALVSVSWSCQDNIPWVA